MTRGDVRPKCGLDSGEQTVDHVLLGPLDNKLTVFTRLLGINNRSHK
jgi:hypothetical protein